MLSVAKKENIVYFDLETQKTAGDVGGWDQKDKMLMSVGVTYSTATDEYTIFSEDRVQDLIDQLKSSTLVVGFNVLNFDYGVLKGYTIWELCEWVPTLDMLIDLEARIGHRLPLESIAQATLGIGKTAEGLDAIRWWRQGLVAKVAEYCCFDVKVTRMVHEYGCRTGEIFYRDRFGQKQRVAVDWGA